MSRSAEASSALLIGSRVAAGVLGGYGFTWGFASLVIGAGLATGADYHDAEQLAYLLAFLVFLTAFLWAFAAASLVRVWAVLAGGGAVMTGIAWWLTRSLAHSVA